MSSRLPRRSPPPRGNRRNFFSVFLVLDELLVAALTVVALAVIAFLAVVADVFLVDMMNSDLERLAGVSLTEFLHEMAIVLPVKMLNDALACFPMEIPDTVPL